MTAETTISTLEVRKDDWRETRVITQELGRELGENEVLFKVDRLALTANNISYAAAGDSLFRASDRLTTSTSSRMIATTITPGWSSSEVRAGVLTVTRAVPAVTSRPSAIHTYTHFSTD